MRWLHEVGTPFVHFDDWDTMTDWKNYVVLPQPKLRLVLGDKELAQREIMRKVRERWAKTSKGSC